MTRESRTERMAAMLVELDERVESAKRHRDLMAQAREESAGWSDPEDRAWAIKAHMEAIAGVIDAERTLAEGRQIVANVSEV